MNYREMADGLLADFPAILAKKPSFQARFATLVKRSRTKAWPLTAQYEYVHPVSGRTYLLCYTAFKRSDWDNPYCNAIGIVEGKGGLYALTTANNRQTVIVFTPHFFQRYAERILKDTEVNGTTLIRRYVSHNTRFVVKQIDERFAKAYRKYKDDESQTWAAEVNEGHLFLKDYGGELLVCRTIISDEMLYDNQTEAFGELKDELRRLGHIKIQGYKDHYNGKK